MYNFLFFLMIIHTRKKQNQELFQHQQRVEHNSTLENSQKKQKILKRVGAKHK